MHPGTPSTPVLCRSLLARIAVCGLCFLLEKGMGGNDNNKFGFSRETDRVGWVVMQLKFLRKENIEPAQTSEV